MSRGILSTYTASGNREDIMYSGAPKKDKRKRVAYLTKGRPRSSNVEDRRGENVYSNGSDELSAWLEEMQKELPPMSEMPTGTAGNVGSDLEDDPVPLPPRKRAPIPRPRPKGR